MERERRRVKNRSLPGCSVELQPGQEIALPKPAQPWERSFGQQSPSQLSKNSENMRPVLERKQTR